MRQTWPADFELAQHVTAFMMPNPRVEIINVCVKLPYTDQVDSSEEAVMESLKIVRISLKLEQPSILNKNRSDWDMQLG